MEKYLKVLASGFITGLALVMVAHLVSSLSGYDDTDKGSERSGLVLYTDYGTGCQYLAMSRNGGITPRMDASGKQVCSGK